MQQRAFSFFQAAVDREITGRYPKKWPGRRPVISPVTAQIATYPTMRARPEQQTALMQEIKYHAMHGDMTATQFFIDTIMKPMTASEQRLLSLNSLCEVAEFTRSAEIYYLVFELLIWKKISLLTPQPSKAFAALIKAAHGSGTSATQAASLLAYLFGEALGYLNYTTATPTISLSHFYQSFRTLEHNQKAQRDGMVAFAELGCKSAINDLITNTLTAEDNENNHTTTQHTGRWNDLALNYHSTLLAGFEKYFNLATQHLCHYGRPPAMGGNHPDNFMCLIDMYAVHVFRSDSRRASSPLVNRIVVMDEIKTMFVNAAKEGALHAAEFLAIEASKADEHGFSFDRNQAHYWDHYLLERQIPDCAILQRAGRRLLSQLQRRNQNSANNDYDEAELALLHQLHRLGCPESAVDLGKHSLRNGDFDRAMQYFRFTTLRTSQPAILAAITQDLINHGCHQRADQLPYFYNIVAQWLKTGELQYFNTLTISNEISKLADEPLFEKWVAILRIRPITDEDKLVEIDRLVDETIHKLLNYYRPENSSGSLKRNRLN